MYTGGYVEEAISTIVRNVWFEKSRGEENRYRRRSGCFDIFNNIFKASASPYHVTPAARIRALPKWTKKFTSSQAPALGRGM